MCEGRKRGKGGRGRGKGRGRGGVGRGRGGHGKADKGHEHDDDDTTHGGGHAEGAHVEDTMALCDADDDVIDDKGEFVDEAKDADYAEDIDEDVVMHDVEDLDAPSVKASPPLYRCPRSSSVHMFCLLFILVVL